MKFSKYSTLPASRAERREYGRALRQTVPLESHGEWHPAPDRPNPIELLRQDDQSRIQHLVPIKYGRMAQSAFAFYRGSALIMASDLAPSPVTGLQVQLCGDAHLSNFGVFATPERKLVFDVNDFDETLPGPWEWDLKRLAASAVIAARANKFSDKRCNAMAREVVLAYADAMKKLSQMETLDVWYFNVTVDDVERVLSKTSKQGGQSARQMRTKAENRTRKATLKEFTHFVDGQRRINSNPPLLERLEDILVRFPNLDISHENVERVWQEYLSSLPDERRALLERYRIEDGALRVGGVGSVGTRCTILLLEGEAPDDAIIVQQKEAGQSVLERYLGASEYESGAARVVHGQRLMQAGSDIFLGWHHSPMTGVDYYWRQLRDMKGSVKVETLDESSFETYVAACASCLARAHARTGSAAAISGYVGKGKQFAKAIAHSAEKYADQTERDYQRLLEAIENGSVSAETVA